VVDLAGDETANIDATTAEGWYEIPVRQVADLERRR
jgi:hypothetical protein